MSGRKLFFLSEMNISDRHGGGLTLQKILAESLDAFDHIIQLVPHKTNFPTHKRYEPRVIELWKDSPSFVYPNFRSRFSLEYLLFFCKRALGVPMPKYQRHDFLNI